MILLAFKDPIINRWISRQTKDASSMAIEKIVLFSAVVFLLLYTYAIGGLFKGEK